MLLWHELVTLISESNALFERLTLKSVRLLLHLGTGLLCIENLLLLRVEKFLTVHRCSKSHICGKVQEPMQSPCLLLLHCRGTAGVEAAF